MGFYEPDDPAGKDPDIAPPAPILPLFIGVGAAVAVYLLWGAAGLPLVGIIGGIFTGAAVVTLLLWRARPAPIVDDEDEGTPGRPR